MPDHGAEELHGQLRRAVAQVCPQWLSYERDDLVQSAVVRVLELQRKGGGERELSFAYLRRVAYSAFIDEIRRRQRRGEVALEPEGGPRRPSRDPDPERRARGGEIGRAIQVCLAALIRPRRRAVTLHLQGHPVPEIAALLGWAAKRSENLVYRGMADLRKCLAQAGIQP